MKIGVLGTGTMGIGIIEVLAQSGYEVVIKGLEIEVVNKAINDIDKYFNKLLEKNKISLVEKAEIMTRLYGTVEMDDIADLDVIIEATPENMDIKKALFRELDQVCSNKTIFASNTSSLSITEMASETKRSDKIIGMHFFNPVPKMKLVEVINGLDTSKETEATILEISNTIAKKPIKVEEAPGFIVNRLLIPMINEAIGVYADGIASVEGIDNAMKFGANHPMGPLALGDMVGLDICFAIMKVLYEEFRDQKYRPHPLLVKMVRAGKLGKKTGMGFYDYSKRAKKVATKTIV